MMITEGTGKILEINKQLQIGEAQDLLDTDGELEREVAMLAFGFDLLGFVMSRAI